MTGKPHESSMAGKLVAVEGLDGSGKSTQVYLLKRWLELDGYKVFFTDCNSSASVRKATRKSKKRQLLTPTTFSLIHSTDFADRYERQVLPLLDAGYIVLADRYVFTAFARDAVRGCNRAWLRKLYDYAVQPDVTFFFDVPLKTALGRILDGRTRVKYHEAGMDMGYSKDPYESFRIFQGKIYAEYRRMVHEYDFTKIDATEAPDVQQGKLREILETKIDLPRYRWQGPVYPQHTE